MMSLNTVNNSFGNTVEKGENLQPIVFFDGVCNLCSFAVQTLIKMDSKGKLKFASLQSETAIKLLPAEFLSQTEQFSTLAFFKNGQVKTESTAVLEIARYIGGFWKIAVLGFIFPRFMRDAFYRFISRNRYHWFGKKDSCWLPTPELKNRFL